MSHGQSIARIAVVGGGLAGMTAAAELARRECRVTLFERKKALGGRASSFRDPVSGRWLDHGRHVCLGCCTNALDLFHQADLANAFDARREIPFVDKQGRIHRFVPSRWLPAPLHLGPGLRRLKLLSRAERAALARTMGRLARSPAVPAEDDQTIETWLHWQGESDEALERFWEPLLVSALGETLDRTAIAPARKVCREALFSTPAGCEMHVPITSLHEIFHRRMGEWLRAMGVDVRLATGVDRVASGSRPSRGGPPDVDGVRLDGGRIEPFAFVILAVPWHRVRGLMPVELLAWMPQLAGLHRFEPVPITAVHLWYDRPIISPPTAVLPGRTAQWLFRVLELPGEVVHQVLVSASHDLIGRGRDEIAACVAEELRGLGPAAREARLLRWRVSHSPTAVFSPRPGLEPHRPEQRTQMPSLALAGDWTATGWPSTLESAVRSGRLAAEVALRRFGRPEQLLTPDLQPGRLARWLLARR